MPLPSELKDREDRLKADETNWQAKKVQLERQIHKYNLTLDELMPKLENINHLITAKTAELDELTTKNRTLLNEVALKEQKLLSIDDKLRKSETILRDIEDVIARKRERVDNDLQEWSKRRRIEYKTEQKADQEAAMHAKENLESIQTQISVKRDEFDQLRQENVAELLGHQQVVEAYKQQVVALEGRVQPLTSEIVALETELAKLGRIREIMVVDTKKAKEQFDGFVAYEARARKILDTKDRELLDKEQELAVEGRHLAARRSNLPAL